MQTYEIPFLSLKDIGLQLTKAAGCAAVENPIGFTTAKAGDFTFYSRNYINGPFKNTEDILDEVIKGTKAGQPVRVTFTKDDAPKGYEEIFTGKGFYRDMDQNGMILDLEKARFGTLTEIHSDKVRKITKDELSKWQDTLFEGFGAKKYREENLYETLIDIKGMSLYGYFENDRILGTTMLLMNGDVSGIHEVTVLPEARKHGACTSMLEKMITDMKETGIKTVSLQASEMGKRVYSRVGFELVSRVETWIYK